MVEASSHSNSELTSDYITTIEPWKHHHCFPFTCLWVYIVQRRLFTYMHKLDFIVWTHRETDLITDSLGFSASSPRTDPGLEASWIKCSSPSSGLFIYSSGHGKRYVYGGIRRHFKTISCWGYSHNDMGKARPWIVFVSQSVWSRLPHVDGRGTFSYLIKWCNSF